MLAQTLAHLRAHDFMRGDVIDRKAIAVRCRDELLKQPVEKPDIAEIQEKGLIVPELRHRVLGDPADPDVESELDAIIQQISGGDGYVQTGLEDGEPGYVLCSSQVVRRLGNGEGSVLIRRRARFVSMNPDVVEQFYWNPAANRLASTMERVKGRLELGVRRLPALAARKAAVIERAYEKMQLELPSPGQTS